MGCLMLHRYKNARISLLAGVISHFFPGSQYDRENRALVGSFWCVWRQLWA